MSWGTASRGSFVVYTFRSVNGAGAVHDHILRPAVLPMHKFCNPSPRLRPFVSPDLGDEWTLALNLTTTTPCIAFNDEMRTVSARAFILC